MPTPLFTMRLPQADQDALLQMSKIYGAPNMRAFAREMISVMCSADVARVKAFNARLIAGVGEQLTIDLNATLDAPRKLTKARKKTGVGKGGRKRGRRA